MGIDLYALLFVSLVLGLGFWKRKQLFSSTPPYALFYSSLKDLLDFPPTWRVRTAFVAPLLFFLGLLALLIALIDPHLLVEREKRAAMPREGLAIYLLLDRSGSMGEPLHELKRGGLEKTTKWDVLKEITGQFIHSLPNDLIGVVAFARGASVIAPLTLDHQEITQQLQRLEVAKTKEEEGTSISYAIYKTAHLVASTKLFQERLPKEEQPPYDIRGMLMFVITDGLQSPSPLDRGNKYRTMEIEQAAEYVKQQGIKLYIINIDPRVNQEQFAPNKREMERAVKKTGGEFLVIDELSQLNPLLEKVQKGEKSRLFLQGAQVERFPFYPFLIALGLLLIGSYAALSNTLWRTAP